MMAQKKESSMNQFILDAIFASKDDSTNASSASTNDNKMIELLEGQLDKKDEQLKKMQTLLDQQQQLTLQSNRQIEQLQLAFSQESDESTETKADKPPSSVPDKKQSEHAEPKQKKGFFSRLFDR